MKKIIMTLAMSIFFATTASAACDMQKATTDFAQFTQKLAQENPEKFADPKTQSEFQALTTEVTQLAQEGKIDEICKKYEDFQKKF